LLKWLSNLIRRKKSTVKTEEEEHEEYLKDGTERLVNDIKKNGSAIKYYLRKISGGDN
jgi:hypothetical protein